MLQKPLTMPSLWWEPPLRLALILAFSVLLTFSNLQTQLAPHFWILLGPQQPLPPSFLPFSQFPASLCYTPHFFTVSFEARVKSTIADVQLKLEDSDWSVWDLGHFCHTYWKWWCLKIVTVSTQCHSWYNCLHFIHIF